jgi:hypothetical protein
MENKDLGVSPELPIVPKSTREAAEGDLIHYSYQPLAAVRSEVQTVPSPGAYRSKYEKPSGLWVSVYGEADWASWCASENFGSLDKAQAYRLTLSPDARILRLPTAFDLDLFTEQYGSDCEWGSTTRYVDRVIDWHRVAADWQGIIIAPYHWSRRLNDLSGWYYGWDCASGCVWDASAVAGLEPVHAPPQPDEDALSDALGHDGSEGESRSPGMNP